MSDGQRLSILRIDLADRWVWGYGWAVVKDSRGNSFQGDQVRC